MPNPISIETIQNSLVEIRGQQVLLDSDVARIYGVQTRDINKAVTNNPDKFPEGYLLNLTKKEKAELVENFHHFNRLKHSPVTPKAFSEKGLYMLATILKSKEATQATLNIIETFAKLRALGSTMQALSTTRDKARQDALMQQSSSIFSELFDDHLRTSDSETSLELNFAVLKLRHTIKRNR
jgi:phage regulator Rha-like protein